MQTPPVSPALDGGAYGRRIPGRPVARGTRVRGAAGPIDRATTLEALDLGIIFLALLFFSRAHILRENFSAISGF